MQYRRTVLVHKPSCRIRMLLFHFERVHEDLLWHKYIMVIKEPTSGSCEKQNLPISVSSFLLILGFYFRYVCTISINLIQNHNLNWKFHKCDHIDFIYHKVASSRLSLLVAHFRIFRLFMKGKFDAYVLWPLAKRVQNWIVDRSTARDFTVYMWEVWWFQ